MTSIHGVAGARSTAFPTTSPSEKPDLTHRVVFRGNPELLRAWKEAIEILADKGSKIQVPETTHFSLDITFSDAAARAQFEEDVLGSRFNDVYHERALALNVGHLLL